MEGSSKNSSLSEICICSDRRRHGGGCRLMCRGAFLFFCSTTTATCRLEFILHPRREMKREAQTMDRLFFFFLLKWRGGELIMEITMMAAVLYWKGLCFYEEIWYSIHTSNVFWTSHVICAERHLVRGLPNWAMQHLSLMSGGGELSGEVMEALKKCTYRTHRQGPWHVICCKKINKKINK